MTKICREAEASLDYYAMFKVRHGWRWWCWRCACCGLLAGSRQSLSSLLCVYVCVLACACACACASAVSPPCS